MYSVITEHFNICQHNFMKTKCFCFDMFWCEYLILRS